MQVAEKKTLKAVCFLKYSDVFNILFKKENHSGASKMFCYWILKTTNIKRGDVYDGRELAGVNPWSLLKCRSFAIPIIATFPN